MFTSGKYFLHKGAYTCVPERPFVCDKCHSDSGYLHAHGRYTRWVKTLKDAVLTPVRVWRQRWRCPCCGRTFGPFDPDRVKRILDDLLAVQPKDLHISFYLDHIRTKLMGGTS